MKLLSFVAVVIILIALLLPGCAAESQVTKTQMKPAPVVKPVTLNISHYIVFKTDPPGAEILVIDSKNGKEAQSFGKTPVRILLMTKTVQYDTVNKRVLDISNTVANTVGLPYGQMKTEGAEFQFKFRLAGYYDEVRIERIPLIAGDSEKVIGLNLVPIKENKK